MTTSRRPILIIGSGGREHAIYRALEQSPSEPLVMCVPGNGGIPLARCVQPPSSSYDDLEMLMEELNPLLIIFGSEVPLVAGYADRLRNEGYLVFGPSQEAAMLEGSKAFMKEFCVRHGISSSEFVIAKSWEEACAGIATFDKPPVIKADGLCGGKGVVLAESVTHAHSTACRMLSGELHGDAGKTIVIEKRLHGRECSVMAFCDGTNAVLLPTARDHKRAYDNDEGPNTGGMGAYSPVPDVSPKLLKRIEEEVILPALRGMKEEGREYRGILYAGLMIVGEDELYVLEFNCRFGDPETQVVLPRIKSDLLPYFLACADVDNGDLSTLDPLRVSSRVAVGVTLASEGYPGAYETGCVFTDRGLDLDSFVFHAGTQPGTMGRFVTSGGRVATVVGLGDTFAEATAAAYKRADMVLFSNKFNRTDIGKNLE